MYIRDRCSTPAARPLFFYVRLDQRNMPPRRTAEVHQQHRRKSAPHASTSRNRHRSITHDNAQPVSPPGLKPPHHSRGRNVGNRREADLGLASRDDRYFDFAGSAYQWRWGQARTALRASAPFRPNLFFFLNTKRIHKHTHGPQV